MQKIKRYDNGLTLVVKTLPHTLSVAIGVFAGVGSIDENKTTNGISHYIEHMTFKGTKTRSAFEISDTVDSIGAQINAFTTKEVTCYYTKSTAEHAEKSMEILSDIFFNSVFDHKEAEKEKNVILEEISMVQDMPDDVCIDGLFSTFFNRHPLAQPILGNAKNIKAFTRQDILDFKDKFYGAQNVVITIAGKVKFSEAENLVAKHFADNFPQTSAEQQLKRSGKRRPIQNFGSAFKDIEQVHLSLAFDGVNIKSNKGNHVAIVNTALGGGMSSRLFQHVREKLGLAYSVYSYPSSYRNSGMVSVYAAVNPLKAQQAAEVIAKEIRLLVDKKLSKEEFLRAKEQLKSSLIFGQESNSSIMNAYGRYTTLTGRLLNINKRLKDLDKVTYDEVCAYLESGAMFNFDHVCAFYVGREKHHFDLSAAILK